jgi:hypothetical protein
MGSTGRSERIRGLLGVGAVAVVLGAAPSCGRPDPDAPPPSPARVVARPSGTVTAEPVRVSFLVPGFAQRFGPDVLVEVAACREAACASATVMLGEGFSAALPAGGSGAEITARIVRDTGALKVTLQVLDAGGTGAGRARSLGLSVTPSPGDGGPRRPYVQVNLRGCDTSPPLEAVSCVDGDRGSD